MSKTFKYEIITEYYYIENSDEYDSCGEEFEYEVDYNDLKDAIIDIIADDYFNGDKKQVEKFLDDFDLYDSLVENLEDDLRDYFEQDAFEWRNNT